MFIVNSVVGNSVYVCIKRYIGFKKNAASY
jgi:hypothetical protein